MDARSGCVDFAATGGGHLAGLFVEEGFVVVARITSTGTGASIASTRVLRMLSMRFDTGGGDFAAAAGADSNGALDGGVTLDTGVNTGAEDSDGVISREGAGSTSGGGGAVGGAVVRGCIGAAVDAGVATDGGSAFCSVTAVSAVESADASDILTGRVRGLGLGFGGGAFAVAGGPLAVDVSGTSTGASVLFLLGIVAIV